MLNRNFLVFVERQSGLRLCALTSVGALFIFIKTLIKNFKCDILILPSKFNKKAQG